jgi:hypothetical protein
MFSQTWKKYLPVITILIKRSAVADQTMSLNHTDFERAAGGRKIKFSFTQLQLNKGRINTEVKHSPFAKELALILQEDDNAKMLIAGQQLEFSLNNHFQLTIKNTSPIAEITTQIAEEETADTLTDGEIAEKTAE